MKKTKLSLILLSLTVIASITISSCKKDDTDDNTTTTTTTPTTNENDLSIPKFTATIDGTNISYIEGTNDFEGICGTDKKYWGFCYDHIQLRDLEQREQLICRNYERNIGITQWKCGFNHII